MPTTARFVRKTRQALPKGIAGHSRARVGFPASKTQQDIVNKAVWLEFGTITSPARPMISNTMDANRGKYLDALRVSAPKILSGKTPIGQVAAKLGVLFENDIKQEMVDMTEPANAPSTIKKKGSSNPTIDTSETKNSVTHETF